MNSLIFKYLNQNKEEKFRNLDGVKIFRDKFYPRASPTAERIMTQKGSVVSEVRYALRQKGWQVIVLRYPEEFRTNLPGFPNNEKRIQIIKRIDKTDPLNKVFRVYKYLVG